LLDFDPWEFGTRESGQNGKNISLIAYFHEEERHQKLRRHSGVKEKIVRVSSNTSIQKICQHLRTL
jgi:hypothetical protein